MSGMLIRRSSIGSTVSRGFRNWVARLSATSTQFHGVPGASPRPRRRSVGPSSRRSGGPPCLLSYSVAAHGLRTSRRGGTPAPGAARRRWPWTSTSAPWRPVVPRAGDAGLTAMFGSNVHFFVRDPRGRGGTHLGGLFGFVSGTGFGWVATSGLPSGLLLNWFVFMMITLAGIDTSRRSRPGGAETCRLWREVPFRGLISGRGHFSVTPDLDLSRRPPEGRPAVTRRTPGRGGW